MEAQTVGLFSIDTGPSVALCFPMHLVDTSVTRCRKEQNVIKSLQHYIDHIYYSAV